MDPSVPRRQECVDAIFMGEFVSRVKLSEFSGSCLRLGSRCLGLTIAKILSLASRDCLHSRLGGAFT